MEIRATQDGQVKRLTGYAATYDTLSNPIPGNGSGTFREKISRGAFDNVVESPDTVLTLNHDKNLVLGRVGAGTLKLTADDKGLRFDCQLPNTTFANDLYENVRAGNMAGCSFAFLSADVDDTWDEGRETVLGAVKRFVLRTISKFRKLIDVSVVTNPAYPGTAVSARNLAAYAEFRSRYEGKFGIAYDGPDVLSSERRQILRSAMDLPNHKRVHGNALVTVVLEARRLAAKKELNTVEQRRFVFLVNAIAELKTAKRSLNSLELDYRNAQLARLGESPIPTSALLIQQHS